MNKVTMVTALALGAILPGCVGTGPATQQGAVAGAVIANNRGGHNGPVGALIGAIAGAIAGGTIGNSIDHQNGEIYGQPVVAVPPYPGPGIPDVAPPEPNATAVWVPGYYAWSGAQYSWIGGY